VLGRRGEKAQPFGRGTGVKKFLCGGELIRLEVELRRDRLLSYRLQGRLTMRGLRCVETQEVVRAARGSLGIYLGGVREMDFGELDVD